MNRTILLVLATAAGWGQSPPAQTPPAQPPAQAAPPVVQSAPAGQPLSAPGATPQIAKDEPEIARHDTRPTFSTGTNLVMVPVIVRDRAGKPIGNLRKEDFQLFDRGKAQVITRFSMEQPSETAKKLAQQMQTAEAAANEGAPASTPRPDAMPTRFVAYLFDDVHLGAGDMMQARTAAQKYFQTTLEPGDRAAIYTTSAQVMLEFTDDREQLNHALLQLRPLMRTATTALDCPPMNFYEADQILRNDPTALQVGTSDAYQCLGGTPPTPGARGAAAAPSPVTPQMAQQQAQSTASRIAAEGEANTQVVLSTILAVVNRMTTAPGQRLLVVVSPGFYITDTYRFNESQLLDKAIHANVMISTIDARGLYTIIAGGDASNPNFVNPATSAQKAMYQSSSALIEGEVLGELADGTGGTWFHNNNDLLEGLRHTAAFPEYQYVIGFSPQNLKYDGAFHKLKVTVRLKADNLQARRGYYAPRHAPNEAEQAKEEIREALFSRDELIDIPVALQTQYFKSSANDAKIAVLARIDLKAIRFEARDGRQFDTLTIVTGLFDRNGQIIDSMSKTVEMHLRPENFDRYLAGGLLEKTSFDAHPGKYVLRLVVRDAQGQTMAARNGVVDIPER